MRAFLVMTILSCSFVLAARAQTQENPAAQTSVVNNPSGQEAALKAELELVREYDARMQNTVYWSLGVVVLVTVLLAGFSWYTNFKVYDRDLNNLRTELTIFVEQEMSSSRSKLNELLSNKIKEISSSQEKLVSDIREEMGNLREHAGKIAINLDEEIKRDLKWLRVDVL